MPLISSRLPLFRLILASVLVVLALLVQQFAQFPLRNGFTESLSNWMHVPMFVGLTAVLLWLQPHRSLWVTVGLVTCIALLSEGLQVLTERQASVADLGKDAVGAGLALWLLRRPQVSKLILATALTAVITLTAPSVYLMAYDHQQRSFPQLYDPDHLRHGILTSSNSPSTVTRTHSWPQYHERSVLEVTWADVTWPGIHFAEPVADWQKYTYLMVDVYNLETNPQNLTAGVRHLHQEGTARYLAQPIAPGHNRLQYKLSHLATLDSGEPARITHLMLYTTRQHAGQHILLGRVWLQ